METPLITDHFLPSPKWFANRVDLVTGIQGRPRFIVIQIGADVTLNGHLFHAAAGQRQVKTAVEGYEARQFATTSAQRVRAPPPLGEELTALYWVEGQDVDSENRW
jgi:hypothetical protein